ETDEPGAELRGESCLDALPGKQLAASEPDVGRTTGQHQEKPEQREADRAWGTGCDVRPVAPLEQQTRVQRHTAAMVTGVLAGRRPLRRMAAEQPEIAMDTFG